MLINILEYLKVLKEGFGLHFGLFRDILDGQDRHDFPDS